MEDTPWPPGLGPTYLGKEADLPTVTHVFAPCVREDRGRFVINLDTTKGPITFQLDAITMSALLGIMLGAAARCEHAAPEVPAVLIQPDHACIHTPPGATIPVLQLTLGLTTLSVALPSTEAWRNVFADLTR